MKQFYMRIVAVSGDRLWVQKWSERYHHVTQSILFADDLMEMIHDEFPEDWEDLAFEYDHNKPDWKTTANFLYDYGCSDEMRRKGEAFIFAH